jgi:MFS family permease
MCRPQLRQEEQMTMQATALGTEPRNPWRSTGAVVLGFLAVVVLSLGTDEVLHLLRVYPPWGQPMFEPRLNLLALSYRIAYSVLGSYIAAKFAPRNPMRHALILGAIGFVLSVLGAIFITTHANLGPAWYPILLVVTAVPCAWLGGILYQRAQLRREAQPASK